METAEDYVEAVANIIELNNACRIVDLANHFAVSHVTVTRTVARLQQGGLLTKEPYRPIKLTEKGRRLARESKQRHEIVLAFLMKLGIDETTANHDSEGIEHHVSAKTLKAMKRFLNDQ